ncbi:E3 ubiquitin-protein ligase TRIM39-like [Sardina pilchardus]|uniref:E3 ubiquitin-protein ligase TRIM39-like n=1 Tax=Sardina pilchardus TaxID=27697 RepID=UPI002E0EFFA4
MISDPALESDIKCAVCQGILSDPTTIPCGHNFCIKCIERCWDMEVYSGTYTCPLCKNTLSRRPTLSRNTTLDSMVQNFLRLRTLLPKEDSMKTQRDIADMKERLKKQTREREEHLEKLRAAMVSLEQSAEAAVQDGEGIFNELLRTLEGKRARHQEHIRERKKALLSRAEKEEKQLIAQISIMRRKDMELDGLVAPVQNNGQFLQKWQEINNTLQQAKQPTVVINNRHFFPFVKTDLKDLRDTVVNKWDEALESIHQQVNDVQILQAPQIKPRNKPDLGVKKHVIVNKSLDVPENDHMKDQGPTIPKREPPVITPKPAPIRRSQTFMEKPTTYMSLFSGKPADSSVTRRDLLKHACFLSLDPETCNPLLQLSDVNRKAMWVDRRQRRPSLPKTFDHWEQVLCVEGLVGGLCYWEVEWRGKGVFIGVALEGLCRKGKGLECGLGRNASSWSLHCTDRQYTAWHNDIEHEITTKSFSPRIGVFLDQLDGTLTFYSISNTVTELYMFKAQNLRGLLFPGFGVGRESSVKLCMLEKHNSPVLC